MNNNNTVLYDHIGMGYNTTRQADPYIAERLFQLLSPDANGLYLDIGCGTGNYTIALANKGLKLTGVEPSLQMLAVARLREPKIGWLCGQAEQIPVSGNMFNGVIATLTIHHWKDMQKAMHEIYRVLKPGARLVLFTATPRQMRGYWLNYYFPETLEQAIVQMPSFNTIRDAAASAGFVISAEEKYVVHDGLKDMFLYAAKNRPQLYLDEEVRKGISSFAAVANLKEIKQGITKLKEDIALGAFETVKANFDNDLGDYLFVVAEKK